MSGVSASMEDPVWIESGGEHIFAMVTHPSGERSDLGVLLLPGGGWMPSTMRNRMYVDLARRLAAEGATVVRVDYQGVGESTGSTPFFDLTRPASSDVTGAAEVLRQLGCERLVAVGACYGGRAGLSALAESQDLAGLVMSATPVEDYAGASESLAWHARRAFSMQTLRNIRARYKKYLRILLKLAFQWLPSVRSEPSATSSMSRDYSARLLEILERSVPVLLLYGRQDRHFPPFQAALAGPFGERLKQYSSLSIDIFEGELHGELTFEAQQFASDRMGAFVRSLIGADAAPFS